MKRYTCILREAGSFETENFSGDSRSGSGVRGFIGFGEERGVMTK